MNTEITQQAWVDLSVSLNVDEVALRAVAAVESAGSGFLPTPPDPPKPKVLFEGHAFHRLTGGRFAADHPNLSYPKWDRSQYSGSLKGEWNRLDLACQLDRSAALQSASWGMFQIMGFNYALCGCPDVEAFVALQHKSADEHLACFARFVARPPFLSALRTHQWDEFASAYNGPAYAKNKYAERLAAAYEKHHTPDAAVTHTKAGARRRKKISKRDALPPGRHRFAPTPVSQRTTERCRNVRPDPVDLRDWEYRPNIALAPPHTMLPNYPTGIKQQGHTNACTGFGLATVVEYLLDRAQRPVEEISGFMIYNMARRYDEWSEDQLDDSGSSLRGAIKGWKRHGASAGHLWRELAMPPATNDPKLDWWLDAAKRPMGAYYRISPENIRDIHVALTEVGAVYASALTHQGWDELLNPERTRAPTGTGPDDIPRISDGTGASDQGHAFAIVGYTQDGFVVQNSWGPEWGRGGLAVLRYSDWLRNAMDCWVIQLGVLTAEHDAVAVARSIRFVAGRAIVSSDETLADREISPFVINMGNEGRLSQRGRFRTGDDDLRALVENHIPFAREAWQLPDRAPMDVGIYAHGGLTNEEAAAKTARTWIPHLYSNRIFPIFLMWETGGLKTIGDLFEDVVRGEEGIVAAGGRLARLKERFKDWKDERLEGLARFPGGKIWGEMKQNADALSGTTDSGIVKLFELLSGPPLRAKLPPIRLHLIGHSAGSIVHSYLGQRAVDHDLLVSSVSFLAPAVRLDTFESLLGRAVAAHRIPMLIANLTDAAERTDDTCRPYGHSLLYLVSRSFEGRDETPLLGMERHLVPALVTQEWGAHIRQLPCPGGAWDATSAATRATTHGGLDDDIAVQRAVASFIRSSVA